MQSADDLITTFEYDYNGNLILVEDPRGLQTTYAYNALGELLEKLPDQSHPNKYCYDKKGRLRFHADPNDFANPLTIIKTITVILTQNMMYLIALLKWVGKTLHSQEIIHKPLLR